ncbi:MAG: hypothetical protein GX580_05430 [Candidatus Hydrogenedens sp.]|nr:hypothetical protein [Candidatus Hydrogenedentota bacterium]NLF57059.1 hypothetical protein [Candidatus Hydrogenedens sp.]
MRYSVTMMMLVLAGLLAGCGGKAPAPPAKSPEELVAEWRQLAAAGRENFKPEAAAEIARLLAEGGPERLTPLLDVIAENPGVPDAKLLAVISLAPVVGEAHQARLIGMTAPDQERITRAQAAHLLTALVGRGQAGPDAVEKLRVLFGDPDSFVAHAALLGMLAVGDPEAVGRSLSLWEDPAVTPPERGKIVMDFPLNLVLEHLDLFSQAALDTALPQPARRHALYLLGTLGNASILDTLKTLAGSEQDPELREMAVKGAAEVQRRIDEKITVTPIGAGPIEVAPSGGGQ